ncbi:hypothetical protein GSI_07964 [Ganoderma sinense ZZ0214-1]|uniref:Uncharacterized protein n=1 Tax=Ganoderma sinense ZZ0214-1 TaxID=1077348 RepID=A0A2G8S7K1_9APHY|nr:hypothetical protein GSI_07964 [Ganoderma sinense ZZ0214-1]
MPQISINPQSTLTLLPPPGHPDRFTYMLNLVGCHTAQPPAPEPGALAIQADNVYTAENMVSPWDPNERVDTYVTGDMDLYVGERPRYGHGILFFEEVPHATAQASPPPLAAPATTPENVDVAIGILLFQVPAPPSPPPLIAAMIERHRAEHLADRATPVRETPGESLVLARALVVALTKALVQVLASTMANTPPPYGTAEETPEITYEKATVSMDEEDYEIEDELEYMELQYPSTPRPEVTPAIAGGLAALDDEDLASQGMPEVIDVDALPDELEEDQLVEATTPRYSLRPHAPAPAEVEPYDPFPDRPNLALRGEEAVNLQLLLTRPPSIWTGNDVQAMKAILSSLRRATKSRVGYGQAVQPDAAHHYA